MIKRNIFKALSATITILLMIALTACGSCSNGDNGENNSTSLDKELKEYAELTADVGLNVQKGDEVYINADQEMSKLAEYCAEAAYRHGARKVTCRYSDSTISNLAYKYQDVETLTEVTQETRDNQQYLKDKKVSLLSIISSAPDVYANADPEKVQAARNAICPEAQALRQSTLRDEQVWCVIAGAGEQWAQEVFPDAGREEAVSKLWNSIFKACMIEGKGKAIGKWNRLYSDSLESNLVNSQ